MQIRFSMISKLFRFQLAQILLVFIVGLVPMALKAQYCTPTFTNACSSGDYIDDFTFNTISNLNTACNNQPQNYIYYNALSTTVAPGSTYPISMQSGPTWGQGFGVWIDYNQDGDFADAGEFVYASPVSGTQLFSGNVTIPVTAFPGLTRMRVMCRFAQVIPAGDFCQAVATFGETEDYNVIIQAPSTDDVGTVSVNSPASGCGLGANEIIGATFGNFGLSAQTTFDVYYSINGGAPVMETWNGNLNPAATVNYNFVTPANLAIPATYNIKVWTSMPLDTNALNDTAYYSVTSIPTVNTFPYLIDFESGNGGWVSGGTNNTWEFGTPTGFFIPFAPSGVNCWATKLAGQYNNSEDSWLLSPCFDFSGLATDPLLRFNHIFETEACCDEGWVEVSVNGGATWAKLGAAGQGSNWYNDAGNQWWDDVSGIGGGWRTADHLLTGTAGQGAVRIRFKFSSDGSVTREGFGVDDIAIYDTLVDVAAVAMLAPISGCSMGPNETITTQVTNYGTIPMTNIPICYTVNAGPPVCAVMPGPVNPGQTGNFTFPVGANLATPGNYTINIYTAAPGDNNPSNDNFTGFVTHVPSVSTFPYVQDFESGQGGWTTGGQNVSWAYGTPAKATIIGAASGLNAWVTGGLGAATYNPNEDNWVESPCFDFTTLSNPWISVNVWWESENNWDGAVLQYSLNGGATWMTLGQLGDPYNWYTNATLIAQPGGQGNGWAGRVNTNDGSAGWVTAKHRLDGLAGQPAVRLRFAFASDASVHDDGFGFDDVFIGDGPVFSIGPDTLLCGGQSLAMDPGQWNTYLWNTGDTNQVEFATSPGIYHVRAADSLGFFGFDTIQVSFSIPNVDLGPDSSVCPGDSVFFDAGNTGATFQWNTGDLTQTTYAVDSGEVIITLWDTVGCETSDTLNLFYWPTEQPMLGADTNVCANNLVYLDAGGGNIIGAQYLWNTGANTQVLIVTGSGQYSVQVTYPGGCSFADTIQVNAVQNPSVNLGADRLACESTILDAGNAGASFLWNNAANTQTLNVTTSGTYVVTVTNALGCSESDSVNITVVPLPNVNIGPNQILCDGAVAVLDAGVGFVAYTWSTGATTQSITTAIPGLYLVQVEDANGCFNTDTAQVTVSTLVADLGPDQTICGNGSIILDAGNPGNNYLWSNGLMTQTITVTIPGVYSVNVSDGLGCVSSDTILVNQIPGINAGIIAPDSGNLFLPVQFTDDSSPGATSWFWDFGDGNTSTLQNPQHTYLAFGVYTVTLTVSNGVCDDVFTVNIIVQTIIGVEDGDFAQNFEVYPNPSSGWINLNLELFKATSLDIDIYDLSGKIVFAKHLDSKMVFQEKIDLSGNASGIYVMRVKAAENILYRKVVLE